MIMIFIAGMAVAIGYGAVACFLSGLWGSSYTDGTLFVMTIFWPIALVLRVAILGSILIASLWVWAETVGVKARKMDKRLC